MKKNLINNLLYVMQRLRDPHYGCPWDKKQTLETIIPYTIEEVYEVAEQVYNKNFLLLKDELGDLLFQVVYLTQIAKEKKKFNFDNVVETITEKMIMRHPHVFSNKKFNNMNEFKNWWENSKNKKNKGILDDIPHTYPAMLKSNKIQKKVSRVGFDYISNSQAIDKIIEEAKELKKEIQNKNKKKIKEELGDLLFSCLDVSRKLKLNPEIILSNANKKFTKRWKFVEKEAKKQKIDINKIDLNKFNKLWNLSKKIN